MIEIVQNNYVNCNVKYLVTCSNCKSLLKAERKDFTERLKINRGTDTDNKTEYIYRCPVCKLISIVSMDEINTTLVEEGKL